MNVYFRLYFTMNPLTNVKNIQKLNQRELELGVIGKKSWHDEYKDSAWIFIGGLPYDLSEGDIVCVFSQYGEVVNINLARDKSTGKSKGFAFLCYEDQRSTVLAVDNLNSIKLLGRIIRVDHVSDYKKPKEKGDEDEATLQLRAEGCAPKVPQPQPPSQSQPLLLEEPTTIRPPPSAFKPKKAKKDKKKKKKKKKKMKVTVKVERRSESDSSSSSSESSDDEDSNGHRQKHKLPAVVLHPDEMKREKKDRGYDRAVHGHQNIERHSRKAREKDKDIKPDLGHADSRHRSHDHYSDQEREKAVVKSEPSDSWKRRDEKRKERRSEKSEQQHQDRESRGDRDGRHRYRDERRDHYRDKDENDRRHR